MNPIDDNLPEIDAPGIDDQTLDLLVDGELADSQQRDLLEQLDRTPDGWRRCALAFLEAQSWTKDLQGITRHSEPQMPAMATAARRAWPKFTSGTLLGMAGSFLVALTLGLIFRDLWPSPGRPGPAPSPLAASDGSPDSVVPQPQETETVRSDAVAEPTTPVSPAEVQYVTLPLTAGPDGAADSIRLPVVARDRFDESWLQEPPSAMPGDLVKALRRSGHRVLQRRGLMPWAMKDGRRLVVPVDQVEVRYVGNPAYQ